MLLNNQHETQDNFSQQCHKISRSFFVDGCLQDASVSIVVEELEIKINMNRVRFKDFSSLANMKQLLNTEGCLTCANITR